MDYDAFIAGLEKLHATNLKLLEELERRRLGRIEVLMGDKVIFGRRPAARPVAKGDPTEGPDPSRV